MFASLRPDVVHTHGYRIDLLDRGIVAGLGIPTVTTVHGASMTGGAKGKILEWAGNFGAQYPLALIPGIVYHLTQMIMDTFVAERFRRRSPPLE